VKEEADDMADALRAARDGAGGILIITAYDADLRAIEAARAGLPVGFPPVRAYPAQVVAEGSERSEVIAAARASGVVVVRLLAGPESLGGLFEPLVAACREAGTPLIVRRAYPMTQETLAEHSTVAEDVSTQLLEYLLHGGPRNAGQALRFLADRLLGGSYGFAPPEEMPWEGYFVPGAELTAGPDAVRRAPWWRDGRPAVGVLFYRNLVQMGETAVVEALAAALDRADVNAVPVFAYGLRASSNGRDNAGAVRALFREGEGGVRVAAIVSLMPFSASVPGPDGVAEAAEGLAALGVPVIHGAMAQGGRAEWMASPVGLGPLDVAMNAALPELDGRLISAPAGFREATGGPSISFEPDRLERLAGLAARWARLSVTSPAEKRVAILLNNPNGRESRAAAAFGLDAPASVVRLLERLRDAGYRVDGLPQDGDHLIHLLLETCPNDPDAASAAQLLGAPCRIPVAQYLAWYRNLPDEVRAGVEAHWGPPPGSVFVAGDAIVVPGVCFGNVFVGPQPQRGFALNRDAILHSPDLPPSHQYLAAYAWLRDVFRADAVVQVGKHGNLEWLPGKAVGLSSHCYPDVALGDLPLVYPYIMNNPGEGTQAKRRAAAAIVDHLVPPLGEAGAYGELAAARAALEALREALETGDGGPRVEALAGRALEAIRAARLDRDLGIDNETPAPAELAQRGLHYLDELESGLIPTGLHVLGNVPGDEDLVELLVSIDRGLGGRSLGAAVAGCLGSGDDRRATAHRAAIVRDVISALVAAGPARASDLLAERLGGEYLAGQAALDELALRILPALRRTGDELERVLGALEGRAVPPGPAGAPTRGQVEALPTGRNFYSLDPRAMPGRGAWEAGCALAEQVIERYLREEGRYPDSVAVIAWGTANIRTRGEDIAQVLHLLGVRPRWDERSGRVTGVEVVPLAELGRPRVDVMLRASGFFRDAFAAAIALVDEAVCTVAALEEPTEQNAVRRHLLADLARGVDPADALLRVFAPRPGAYVDGVVQAVENGAWQTRRDLGEVYGAWVDHGYTRERYGVAAREAFTRRASELSVVLKTRDNEEHDVLDTDDYFQDFGGMVAFAREVAGAEVKAWIGDSTRPWATTVRPADDEVRRTLRRRALNPKWLAGMEQHGYQGGSEMLKTVDYAFGFDATAGVLEDWMYERLAEVYVADRARQAFLLKHNPWALRDMASRLLEAAKRGLWETPEPATVERLERALLAAEGAIEDRGATR